MGDGLVWRVKEGRDEHNQDDTGKRPFPGATTGHDAAIFRQ